MYITIKKFILDHIIDMEYKASNNDRIKMEAFFLNDTMLPPEIYRRLIMETGDYLPMDSNEINLAGPTDSNERNSHAIRLDLPNILDLELEDVDKTMRPSSILSMLEQCCVYDSVKCFDHIMERKVMFWVDKIMNDESKSHPELSDRITIRDKFLRQYLTKQILNAVYEYDAYKIAVWIYNNLVSKDLLTALSDHSWRFEIGRVMGIIGYKLVKLGKLDYLKEFFSIKKFFVYGNVVSTIIKRGTLSDYITCEQVAGDISSRYVEVCIRNALNCGRLVFLKYIVHRTTEKYDNIAIPEINGYSRLLCATYLLEQGFSFDKVTMWGAVRDFNNAASKIFMERLITENSKTSIEKMLNNHTMGRRDKLPYQYLDYLYRTTGVVDPLDNFRSRIHIISGLENVDNAVDGRFFIWYRANRRQIRKNSSSSNIIGGTMDKYIQIGKYMTEPTLEDALTKLDEKFGNFFENSYGDKIISREYFIASYEKAHREY